MFLKEVCFLCSGFAAYVSFVETGGVKEGGYVEELVLERLGSTLFNFFSMLNVRVLCACMHACLRVCACVCVCFVPFHLCL